MFTESAKGTVVEWISVGVGQILTLSCRSPLLRWICVDLTGTKAGYSLRFLEVEVRVILSDARLRIEKGHAKLSLDAETRVEVGAELDELAVRGIVEELLDFVQLWRVNIYVDRCGCSESHF